MRRLSGIIGVCVVAGVLGSVVGLASALVNNGFDTDHYFTAATYRPSYYGRIKQFEESTGDEWPTQPEFTPWNKYMSLTFAGTGSNDARMFVLAPNDWKDPRILEFRYDTATHEGVEV